MSHTEMVVEEQSHERDQIFVAFKRAPLSHKMQDGKVVSIFARGGAAGVVAEVAQQLGATVVASAISGDEIACAEANEQGFEVQAGHQKPLRVRLVRHSTEVGETTQTYFFSEVLWPAMHDLWERWRTPVFDEQLPVSWNRYRQFLDDYEETLSDLAANSHRSAFLVHDYQLIGLPGVLRAKHPESRIGLFYHCAWSGPDSWSVLPGDITATLVQSMCQSDWIGFYSNTWVDNFLLCVERFHPLAVVDTAARRIEVRGHVCELGVLSLGYSPDALQDLDIALPSDIANWAGEARVVVTYGRTNPNKNLARTVEAFRRAVLGDERLVGTKLLLRLALHNLDIESGRRCYADIIDAVERVRETLGEDSIMIVEENNMAATLASYKRADALIFIPVADGQNLSPFEGIMVNTRDAGVVLSNMMGAAEALKGVATIVSPYDVQGQAQALREELLKSPAVRKREFARRRAVAETLTVQQWVNGQIEGLLGTEKHKKRDNT